MQWGIKGIFLKRPLEPGIHRLISGLEIKSLGVEHGAVSTQEALSEEGEFTSKACSGAERGQNLNGCLQLRLISI